MGTPHCSKLGGRSFLTVLKLSGREFMPKMQGSDQQYLVSNGDRFRKRRQCRRYAGGPPCRRIGNLDGSMAAECNWQKCHCETRARSTLTLRGSIPRKETREIIEEAVSRRAFMHNRAGYICNNSISASSTPRTMRSLCPRHPLPSGDLSIPSW
jgi:hypothetical protein